jgi:hypothetical protein
MWVLQGETMASPGRISKDESRLGGGVDFLRSPERANAHLQCHALEGGKPSAPTKLRLNPEISRKLFRANRTGTFRKTAVQNVI